MGESANLKTTNTALAAALVHRALNGYAQGRTHWPRAPNLITEQEQNKPGLVVRP